MHSLCMFIVYKAFGYYFLVIGLKRGKDVDKIKDWIQVKVKGQKGVFGVTFLESSVIFTSPVTQHRVIILTFAFLFFLIS